MKIYVVLTTNELDLDNMTYVGCSLSYKGALDIIKSKFGKYYKDNATSDTDSKEYFRTSKDSYKGSLICIKTEEVI